MRAAPSDTRVGDDSRAVGAVLLALETWAWEPLHERAAWAHALATLATLPEVREVAILVPPASQARARGILRAVPLPQQHHLLEWTPAEAQFPAALARGIAALSASLESIAILDGANPLLLPATLRAALQAAQPGTVALTTEPVKDTIKVVREQRIEGTLPRERLTSIHFPLTATREDLATLLASMQSPTRMTGPGTQRAATVGAGWLAQIAAEIAHARLRLSAVPGSADTISVHSVEDLAVVERLLATHGRISP